MVSIGSFARLGGVSVRMLRHYDKIGLLVPASIDPHTGHRAYDLGQLARLNRIVALKGLGFTLDEVTGLLQEGIESEALAGMLRLRQSQLEHQIHHHRHRLDRVAARLAIIAKEHEMSETIRLKSIPAQRLAGHSVTAGDSSRMTVGPQVADLFARVADLMDQASGDRTAPVARYAPDLKHPPAVQITAGYVVLEDDIPGLELQDLPAVDVAAVLHHGVMSGIAGAYQVLAHWAAASGYEKSLEAGCWREVYLEAHGEEQREWLVEVQLELNTAIDQGEAFRHVTS